MGGLSTALSGLQTHQRVLEVIGHNVSNVNTEGFSRRNATLSTSGLGAVSAIFSPNNGNGDGVKIDEILRIRDSFLESRALTEFANNGYAYRSSQVMTRLEQAFPEPSDTGISAQLATFWAAFDDAANQPDSIAARAQVLENASALIGTFARASADLKLQQRGIETELQTAVSQVNSMTTEIAKLNGQIRQATAAGLNAHDLSDQRDLMVEQVIALTGGTTRQGDYGTLDVYVGGSPLVFNNLSNNIQVATNVTLTSPLDASGLTGVQVQWAAGGYPVNSTGGELAGLAAGANESIPTYMNEINTVVSNLVTSVNTLHLGGQGLGGVADTNLNFFDPAGVRADNLKISADIAGQPSRIGLATAGAGALDATVGQKIAALVDSPTGPDAAFAKMVGTLGIQTAAANQRAEAQQNIALDADARRKDISGVNLDEEMTKLIATQRAYEASARLLTTIDQLLDTLINRTGLVGR